MSGKAAYCFLLVLPVLLTIPDACASARGHTVSTLEIEGAAVWQSRNDVQIPNDESGTRFSLIDLLGTGPIPAARLYLTWNINKRNAVRILLAPLSVTASDVLPSPVDFAGATFAAGLPTEATYKFNSWRITYRYRFWNGRRAEWHIGFTAKIRDAMIRLEQGATSAKKTDVGFVPLLNLNARYRLAARWELAFDVDALAGGPGRAIDLSLKLYGSITERWGISCGYRTVEGGADVDEVYNFAWIHYAVMSAQCNF